MERLEAKKFIEETHRIIEDDESCLILPGRSHSRSGYGDLRISKGVVFGDVFKTEGHSFCDFKQLLTQEGLQILTLRQFVDLGQDFLDLRVYDARGNLIPDSERAELYANIFLKASQPGSWELEFFNTKHDSASKKSSPSKKDVGLEHWLRFADSEGLPSGKLKEYKEEKYPCRHLLEYYPIYQGEYMSYYRGLCGKWLIGTRPRESRIFHCVRIAKKLEGVI